MAYVTGTASSMANLLTALRNACTANGWTLSGDVLHKGTCYVRTATSQLGDNAAPANGKVELQVGNGIDGSNLLTDPAPIPGGFGIMRAAGSDNTYPDWDWPVTYHCHVLTDPDEVYFVVSYESGTRWQWLAFGQSPTPGNAGTGNWQSATQGRSYGGDVFMRADRCALSLTGGTYYAGTTQGNWVPAPFFMYYVWSQSFRQVNQSSIHGAIDETTGLPAWSRADAGFGQGGTDQQVVDFSPQVAACYSNTPLLEYTPNAFNQELVLLPMQLLQRRPSDKVSVVGDLQHMRICRNDFVDPGEVITRGPEKWKVYPFHKKYIEARDPPNIGSNSSSRNAHTGTMAMAIRYDGP